MGPAARRSSAVALAALCGIAPATAWAAGRPSAPRAPVSSTSKTGATTVTTTRGHSPTTVRPTRTSTSTVTGAATRSTSASRTTSLPKPPASTPAARSVANLTIPKPTIFKTTPEDHSVVVTVKQGVTLSSTTQPAHGHDRITGARTILYTPDTGYVSPTGTADIFTYTGTVSTPNGPVPATGEVDVTVTEVPPTARNATVDTTTGKAVGVDLTALTTVTRGNTATYKVSDPVHGTVTTTPSGAATFTPAAGFTGDGRFTYTVTDNHGGTATATVTVHVSAAQTTTTTTTPPATTHTQPPPAGPVATPVASASPTTAAPSALAFTGANDDAVGLVGATLVAGGGLLTVLARRRRLRHPTWRHLRRS